MCPNLTIPENGQVVQLLDGNVPGTFANYSCDAGYRVSGNVSRECVSTGLEAVWTGEAPTCQRKILTKNVNTGTYHSMFGHFVTAATCTGTCNNAFLQWHLASYTYTVNAADIVG